MLDWPEHSHTSPTRMSESVWAAPDEARATSVNGPPAPIAGSSADQRPEASARALACRPPIETLTVSPAVALPHTAIGRSRCSTAWSWKMEASSGFGGAWSAAARPDATTATASAATPPHVNDARLATHDLPADALQLQRAPHVRCAGQRLSAADADLHRGLRQVVGTERERHLPALACTQMDPLESAQVPYRALPPRGRRRRRAEPPRRRPGPRCS